MTALTGAIADLLQQHSRTVLARQDAAISSLRQSVSTTQDTVQRGNQTVVESIQALSAKGQQFIDATKAASAANTAALDAGQQVCRRLCCGLEWVVTVGVLCYGWTRCECHHARRCLPLSWDL